MSTETVVTLKEWKDKIIDSYGDKYDFLSHTNLPAADFLSDIPNLAGYMQSPVAEYQGSTLTAYARKLNNIVEIKDELLKLDSKFFLYDIVYHPSLPLFASINTDTFEIERLDNIKMSEAYWTIRYAVLNEVA
jgi:hypothetical protein